MDRIQVTLVARTAAWLSNLNIPSVFQYYYVRRNALSTRHVVLEMPQAIEKRGGHTIYGRGRSGLLGRGTIVPRPILEARPMSLFLCFSVIMISIR